MKSLYIQSNNKEMIDRIQRLRTTSKAEWGKMTVSQMVVHAQAPFRVAFEELNLKHSLIGKLFGGIARKKLFGPDPFGINLPQNECAGLLQFLNSPYPPHFWL